MSEAYPITTRELIAIAGKEIAKTIPIAGSIVSAGEAIFSAIEMKRIQSVLAEAMRCLEAVEKQTHKAHVFDENSALVVLHGCEQARLDPLAHKKAPEYGAAIAKYMMQPANPDELVEVVENIRKISADDLKLLYQFKVEGVVLEGRRVDELVGYRPQIQPFGGRGRLRENMANAFPSFKRLEALGVLYLADTRDGGVVHQIGALSEYMSQSAILTQTGRRLVEALAC